MPQQANAQFCGTQFFGERLIQAKVLARLGLQKQKMVQETKQSLDQNGIA
jgi:hypothetical protein